ncbi:hypothetical protein EV356DRAFT_570914 [Viridothelium virens]|uniref:Zn(2)-C6 fungal-type domain-containing protein n=1 Tax=Viridothelium virens TaxID=1048519 RepID=A0A6A6GVD7_VIRVR|nr:hypothetical protein EV356DRAFT_570914 [Viridothelium virens]
MCSASKVRCDKRRPVCSRCARLGYPCFYSPARRVRKRKYSSEETVGDDVETKTDARQNVQTNSTGGQGHDPYSAPAGTFDDNETFNFTNLESLSNSNWNKLTSGIPFTRNQVGLEQKDDFSMVDLEGNGAADCGSAHPSNLTFSTNVSSVPTTLHHHGLSESSLESVFSHGEADKASMPNDDADCAIVAMSILQRLSTSTPRQISPSSSSTSTGPVSPTSSSATHDANVQFQTVAVAIKRASTILICPCSRRGDVGLLVITVCIALLDMLEAMLHGTAPSQIDHSSKSKRSTFKRSPMNTIMRNLATSLEIGARNLRDDSDFTTKTMHILEQLPQVASLVTQFMKRYEQDMQRGGSDLLGALGASVMCRLKGMTDEVTDRMAQAG